jgi:hypothetical protein
VSKSCQISCSKSGNFSCKTYQFSICSIGRKMLRVRNSSISCPVPVGSGHVCKYAQGAVATVGNKQSSEGEEQNAHSSASANHHIMSSGQLPVTCLVERYYVRVHIHGARRCELHVRLLAEMGTLSGPYRAAWWLPRGRGRVMVAMCLDDLNGYAFNTKLETSRNSRFI